MSRASFTALADQGYNRIPVVLETYADLDSPLSVYLKLANAPYSYLLESVQGGERFGRYSFIGLPTTERLIYEHHADGGVLSHIQGTRVCAQHTTEDPLSQVREFLAQLKVAPLPIPTRFAGGLVGYFGYDTARLIEPSLKAGRKKANSPATDVPDILLLLSEELAVVDNLTGKLSLVVYADPRIRGAHDKARERLSELLEKLRSPLSPPMSTPSGVLVPKYRVSKESFMGSVNRAKEYIAAGDIFQVVLSHPVECPFSADPLSFYRALRSINPSPYMFYFNFEDFQVVGTSPEILVRQQGGEITVRPIAGTRRRGTTTAQDTALAEELLADEKERAEHMMLLDLGRNDVGRVAQAGSIKVTEEMVIERYSHVMHMVSNVQGTAREEMDAMATLSATFPAGTVSGAPKVRAMAIIDELESEPRGIYSGAVGYVGFNGDMDVAIALRTAVIRQSCLRIQAGAGIVADSNPLAEWEETLAKAKVLLTAAQLAIDGLDTQFID